MCTCVWYMRHTISIVSSYHYFATSTPSRILHKAMESRGHHDRDFQCFHNFHYSRGELHSLYIIGGGGRGHASRPLENYDLQACFGSVRNGI